MVTRVSGSELWWSRRAVLRSLLGGVSVLVSGPMGWGCGTSSSGRLIEDSRLDAIGPLGDPDANGVRLPAGFSSRIVARSGDPPVASSAYIWPTWPDGGACFATEGGGWVYVANSEVGNNGGGVAGLRFDARGNVVDAYSILQGTSRNCAGGLTPWGTWLSCEEVDSGRVWECDPLGRRAAVVHPALGTFNHEAAVVDPDGGNVYLSEDKPDGRLYRFTPERAQPRGPLDLSAGTLAVARIVEPAADGGGRVEWLAVADPAASDTPTRHQVPTSTPFNGGEGMWCAHGAVYLVTKGDNRVWMYRPADQIISVLYDDDSFAEPVLTGLDNVVVSPSGDVLVAEDGGNMQLVAITPRGGVVALAELPGQPLSEVAGPAFDPSGKRLYFSSQRGGLSLAGITYEIRGPF
jgi:DNA-binding beta-propeller fold protein YncE